MSISVRSSNSFANTLANSKDSIRDDCSDESLATSFSALEISCERASLSASRMAWSSASSSYSPTEELSSSQRPEGSKRRSLTEMSQSARMTPQSQRERGLGLPWLHAHGLCIVDVQADDVDEGRQFCLIPTPELADKPKSRPSSPELHSPSSMQRRFTDLVHRASLGQGSPEASPDTKMSRRNSLASQVLESTPDTLSPVSPMQDCVHMSEPIPTTEKRFLLGQFACDSGAPTRVPLIRRLGERLSKTVNHMNHIGFDPGPAIACKGQYETFMEQTDRYHHSTCGIFEDAPALEVHPANGCSAASSHSSIADDLENTPPVEYPPNMDVKTLVQKFDGLGNVSPAVEYTPIANVRTLVKQFDQVGRVNGRLKQATATRKSSSHMRRSISRSPVRRLMPNRGQARRIVS